MSKFKCKIREEKNHFSTQTLATVNECTARSFTYFHHLYNSNPKSIQKFKALLTKNDGISLYNFRISMHILTVNRPQTNIRKSFSKIIISLYYWKLLLHVWPYWSRYH